MLSLWLRTIASSPFHEELRRDGDLCWNAGKGSVADVIQGLRECGGLLVIRIAATCSKYCTNENNKAKMNVA